MQTFFSGSIVGVILFHSAVVAPLVFGTLQAEDSARLIRRIFPRFFLLLALLASGSLLSALLLEGLALSMGLAVGTLSVCLALLCRALIPATNRARDEGLVSRFAWLHRASVLLTLVVLFANVAVLFVSS